MRNWERRSRLGRSSGVVVVRGLESGAFRMFSRGSEKASRSGWVGFVRSGKAKTRYDVP